MSMNNKTWYTALTGLAFLIIVVIGVLLSGESATATDDSVAKIAAFYDDNQTKLIVSLLLEALAATVLVWYGLHLRNALKESAVAPLIVIGTAIVAIGLAFDASVTFALVDASNDPDVAIAPATIQTLQLIYDNDFIPFVVGASLISLSAGIATLQTGVFPKWLGWIAVVIGVLAFAGPAGFIAILLLIIWMAVTSVMLALRAKNAPA